SQNPGGVRFFTVSPSLGRFGQQPPQGNPLNQLSTIDWRTFYTPVSVSFCNPSKADRGSIA
ncbi:MAG: hypothetical protein Q7R64_00100, partial [bacterium]|nr:hypothetical protein [bacterium]